MIEFLQLLLVIYLFHREAVCGKNISHMVATTRFRSSDDFVAVVGAGVGISSVGT